MFILRGLDVADLPVSNKLIWTGAIIALVVIGTFYALRSIALYTMAKKQGLKNAFLAYIPLVWMYTACKLVGKVRVFGSTFEKLAIWFCIIFSVAEILNLFYQFIIYFPVIGNFLAGNELYIIVSEGEGFSGLTDGLKQIWGNFSVYGGANFSDPYEKMGLYPEVLSPIMDAVYYSSLVFDLASIIITISVYINLFKKYWPQHFILMAVLSWMGIFAPLVFVARNREPMDYNEYVRNRYNNMYANGNPYGGVYNKPPQAPPTPFEEFAEKGEVDPGDPFAEFSSKKNNDREDI